MRQKAHCGVRRHLACDDDLRILQMRRRLEASFFCERSGLFIKKESFYKKNIPRHLRHIRGIEDSSLCQEESIH